MFFDHFFLQNRKEVDFARAAASDHASCGVRHAASAANHEREPWDPPRALVCRERAAVDWRGAGKTAEPAKPPQPAVVLVRV